MNLTVSILQSILSIIFLLLFWLIQSTIILYITRKYIFKILFRNKLIEWIFVQPSIAVHEISHIFAAVFTGSYVSESFISPRAGRVTALSSESIGGWISRIIAAFAPSFQTFLILIILTLLFPHAIPEDFNISTLFEYKEDYREITNEILVAVNSFFVMISNIFKSLTPNSIIILVFILYLLIILSITATPSEDDWKAALQVILSPVPFFSIFLSFISIYVVFSYFKIGFLAPMISILIINFIIAIFGIFVSTLFSKLIDTLGNL